MTPLIQPHESSRAHPGETQESSGPINKVWKDILRGEGEEAGEGDLSLSLLMHICTYVCVSEKEVHICRAVAV